MASGSKFSSWKTPSTIPTRFQASQDGPGEQLDRPAPAFPDGLLLSPGRIPGASFGDPFGDARRQQRRRSFDGRDERDVRAPSPGPAAYSMLDEFETEVGGGAGAGDGDGQVRKQATEGGMVPEAGLETMPASIAAMTTTTTTTPATDADRQLDEAPVVPTIALSPDQGEHESGSALVDDDAAAGPNQGLEPEWDASKVPPSQFQRRRGSIFATPGSRDSHVDDKNRDKAYHDKLKEKGWHVRRDSLGRAV